MMRRRVKRTVVAGLMLLLAVLPAGAEEIGVILGRLLGQSDTAYVSNERYNSYANVYMFNTTQTFDFTMVDASQRMSISPYRQPELGVGVGRGFIALSYSKSLDDMFAHGDTRNSQFTFNIIANRFGIQFFDRKVRGVSKITSSSGFNMYKVGGYTGSDTDEPIEITGTPTSLTGRDYEGFSSRETGVDFYYVFNYKHFSYKAAYGYSTRQNRSAGSVVAGLNYANLRSTLDLTADPFIDDVTYKQWQADPSKTFDYVACMTDTINVGYRKLSVKFGYSYNWAFAHDLVLNGTLLPMLNLRWTKIDSRYEDYDLGSVVEHDYNRSLSLDLMGQASLQWNNGKMYAGLSAGFNTFRINRPSLKMSKVYGEARLCVGVYFDTFVKKSGNPRQ